MRIFLSYRRDDSRDATARLADRLADLPGVKSVFLDVESIAAGEAFPDRLRSAMAEADICLVLIGDKWLGQTIKGARPRISNENDFVRMEVAEALRLGKRVIPVLLNEADMPTRDQLPEELHPLLDRNALFVRHISFSQDVEILNDAIFHSQTAPRLGKRKQWTVANIGLRLLGGLAMAVILLLIIGLISFSLSGGQSLETLLGGRAGLGLLVLAILGLCQALSFGVIRLPLRRT
ncbi:toll/interleukin-1 receptor domain-containing protein [Sphingorhabdus sp. EL138]|uniref:toll/interleukin-1 receptor domain-containing protein n=1 Tax=Sphingorhabdus sp. EL138 TaxID=2073156 RepID=UPI000D6954EA|nr:toll/interleukin-1 receptor domain-containing protein [Sphingorhabdus sp. EL138]